MTRPASHAGPCTQSGIVAVEMALILLCFFAFLPLPQMMGRAFWHYAVLQKAAHDAARYMSAIPALDMKNAQKQSQAAAVARSMVSAATAGFREPVVVLVMCDASDCGAFSGVPSQVQIRTGVTLTDEIFTTLTSLLTGDEGLVLNVNVTMPYANN